MFPRFSDLTVRHWISDSRRFELTYCLHLQGFKVHEECQRRLRSGGYGPSSQFEIPPAKLLIFTRRLLKAADKISVPCVKKQTFSFTKEILQQSPLPQEQGK